MSKNTGKFILGAALGAGLALLLAPKSGKETREDLKIKFEEIKVKINETDIEDLKESVHNKINEIEADLKKLDTEKVLKVAKEKAKAIESKVEELIVMAGKAAKPKVEELAKDVKVKTIKSLKTTIKKLEDTK